jgi:parvulin-like peptidyl-prolyl isomerase
MPSESQDFFDIHKASVRRAMVLLALGALTGLAIAGYGLFTARGTRSRDVPPEAIALVNQRPILRSDFMTQAQTQFSVPFAQTSHEERLRIVRDMINEELMTQRGLEIDLPSYDPDVRNALVAGVELEVTADVLARQPTPEEMHAYYDEHTDRYSSEGVMQLRDLEIKTDATHPSASARTTVAAAIAALRAGTPVDTVVAKFTLVDSGRFMDAGQVDTGDILQFAVRAKVDDAIYNATMPLKDGEVSEPIEEGDGVHLIYMIKHRLPVAQTFEKAANNVWSDLKREAQDKVNAANIAYLRSRADIIVAPDYAR